MARQPSRGGAADAPKQASSQSSSRAAKPKRVRRKCSVPNCLNRVVQGGVCVTHGARRKLCSHPGCDKAVKLAGFCSTHGPARRKCDHPDCTRVAVQGGKCLSHGARRRVCAYPGGRCNKNAIMGGMCKKHYDRVQDAEGMLEMSLCVPVGSAPSFAPAPACPPGSGGVQGAQARGGLPRGGSFPGTKFGSGGWGRGAGSGGEFSEDGGESALSSPSSSAGMYLKPCPSWGSAAPTLTISTAPSADAAALPSTGGPPLTPSASAPNLAAIGRHHYRREHGKAKPSPRRAQHAKPSPRQVQHSHQHQRGLSIFDEMHTVDAIINSGSAEKEEAPRRVAVRGGGMTAAAAVAMPQQPLAPPSLPPQRLGRPPLAYPPRYPQATAPAHPAVQSRGGGVALPTKTPAPQVSFADCVKAPRSACTGNSSCTCDACRSPTLAIFEQMIVASQQLESGALDLEEYAGLSTPKLGQGSPRKAAAGLTTPSGSRQASFLPEEPASTGSVVRTVSRGNLLDDDSSEGVAARALRQRYLHGVRAASIGGHQDTTAAVGTTGRQPQPQEGPASQALAASIALGRTVSHDREERQHRRGRAAGGGGHRWPAAQDSLSRLPPRYPSHVQEQSQYQSSSQQARPPSSYSYPHDSGSSTGAAPADFFPPQTPTLCDTLSPVLQQPLSVISGHSTTSQHPYGHDHLLPKPRENLFVPKEV